VDMPKVDLVTVVVVAGVAYLGWRLYQGSSGSSARPAHVETQAEREAKVQRTLLARREREIADGIQRNEDAGTPGGVFALDAPGGVLRQSAGGPGGRGK
jgi:hypothetical protein